MSPTATSATAATSAPATGMSEKAYPACAHCSQEAYLLPEYSRSQSAGQASPMSDLMTKVAGTVASEVQALDAELRDFSIKMHDQPEVAWEEHKTHDLFIDYLKAKKGWKVTPKFGLDTAFKAEFEHVPEGHKLAAGEKLPVIGFNSELDALPGIGHACGHVSVCGQSLKRR